MFVTLLFQVYVLAPPPFKVTIVPEHTVVALVFAVTVGKAFTVTVLVAVNGRTQLELAFCTCVKAIV